MSALIKFVHQGKGFFPPVDGSPRGIYTFIFNLGIFQPFIMLQFFPMSGYILNHWHLTCIFAKYPSVIQIWRHICIANLGYFHVLVLYRLVLLNVELLSGASTWCFPQTWHDFFGKTADKILWIPYEQKDVHSWRPFPLRQYFPYFIFRICHFPPSPERLKNWEILNINSIRIK